MVADKHGDRYSLRIYSGKLKTQSRVFNAGRDFKELVSKIYHIHADPERNLEEVDEAVAGDIVALIGLRESITGDTLCDGQHPILLEAIHFAESVVSQSIEPQSFRGQGSIDRRRSRLCGVRTQLLFGRYTRIRGKR